MVRSALSSRGTRVEIDLEKENADGFIVNPTLLELREPFRTVIFLPLLGFRHGQGDLAP